MPLLPALLTLDTNLVVLLISDDPQQTPLAERAFLDAMAGWSGWYVPVVLWWMTSTR